MPADLEELFGTLSRAEVRAQVMQDRAQLSSAGIEGRLQQQAGLHPDSGYTREQARWESTPIQVGRPLAKPST